MIDQQAKSERCTVADPVVIRLRENGPLVVHGAVKILDHQGNEVAPPVGKENLALCRCGHSNSKPVCDGSHRSTGFVANEVVKPKEA
jgi:CDGSH-type Zn-finger protein